MSIKVSAIHYYPIKSCGGITVDSAELVEKGFKHDRAWMLVKEDGHQITQRDFASMALIKTRVNPDNSLSLDAPDMDGLRVGALQDGPVTKGIVWGQECSAIDQGDAAAEWFEKYLGGKCRLVMMKEDFRRRVDEERLPDREFVSRFNDQYPLMMISQGSLDDLNEKLEFPVLMNRFRPNLVIEGCGPFEEDSWKRFSINDIVFRVVKPCTRCVIVTIDQEDASIGKEPLRTLAGFRKIDGKINFGQNLAHESNGVINVGDALTVLE